jgi:hypothetical protein
VEGERFRNSVIWQTHSSPDRRERSVRTRFPSARAFVMARNSRMIDLLYFVG